MINAGTFFERITIRLVGTRTSDGSGGYATITNDVTMRARIELLEPKDATNEGLNTSVQGYKITIRRKEIDLPSSGFDILWSGGVLKVNTLKNPRGSKRNREWIIIASEFDGQTIEQN